MSPGGAPAATIGAGSAGRAAVGSGTVTVGIAAAGVAAASDGRVGGGSAKDEPTATDTALVESAFAVDGMFCGGCAATVERALRRLPGVHDVAVSFLSDSAFVRHDPARVGRAALLERLAALGYETRPLGDKDGRAAQGAFQKAHAIRLAIAVGFGMWVMLAVIARYFTELPDARFAWWLGVASGVLSLPVLLYSGGPFHRLGWRGLRSGVPGMESLILVATVAAVGLSCWTLATGGSEVWFEVPVMLIVFQLVARLGDFGARRRAADAVRAMLDLSPERARRVRAVGRGGETIDDVAVAELAVGDLIESRAGERLAADGEITSGSALIDTSLLSGESLPRPVGPGDAVLAGTLNVDGALRIRVRAAGGERTLDRLATTVGRALNAKSDLMRMIDRVAGALIPAIGAAALVAFALALASGEPIADAIVRALATLVVSCPCALSLAVPLVVSTSAANAAREGIVLRDAAALERADRIDVVLLDKTGTLTRGELAVARVVVAAGEREADVLRLAALAERGSNHPLARAVLDAARAGRADDAGAGSATIGRAGESADDAGAGVAKDGRASRAAEDASAGVATGEAADETVEDAGDGVVKDNSGGRIEDGATEAESEVVVERHERAGAGVRVTLADGRRLLAGSAPWLAEHGIEALPDTVDPSCSRVIVAVGARAIGAIELADTPRDDAAALLASLRARGLEPVLASGDTAGATSALAERLDLPWHAPLDPDGKRALVESLGNEGRRVAFVGDGLNDAPALAAADLGIATGEASDLARSAAAMSVLHGGLERIDVALRLARRAAATLRRNLALAIGFNALLLPAAVLGFLHPLMAVLAMAASSLSVSLSSLALARRVGGRDERPSRRMPNDTPTAEKSSAVR